MCGSCEKASSVLGIRAKTENKTASIVMTCSGPGGSLHYERELRQAKIAYVVLSQLLPSVAFTTAAR